jgi:hypothetical protein
MSVLLFVLPEYDFAFRKFFHTTVHELMSAKDQVFGSIKKSRGMGTHIIQNTMPSGYVLQGKPIEMLLKFVIDHNDVLSCNVTGIAAILDKTADDALKQVMPQMFERFGEVCDAAGTATNANGQPLSHELILKSFENVEIEFDEHDNPVLPTLVVSPDMSEALQKLKPMTEEQQRAWDEMIEKKRREFNDRRRHRQLS